MDKTVKLITTPTYYSVFDNLIECLKGKTVGLLGKNLIFCEEKVSLMAERRICSALDATFNTEVCSFGKFLKKFPKETDVEELNKESAAMAIKLIISKYKLNLLSNKSTGISAKLFDLIMQLKSSKISLDDLKNAKDKSSGILKNKLEDIYNVYSEYEKFLNGESELNRSKKYLDQSSVLERLPSLIKSDDKLGIDNSDVYVIGYTNFTRQAMDIIKSLILKAKSVTFILTDGKNGNIYTGEAVSAVKSIKDELGIEIEEIKNDAALLTGENLILANNLFNRFDGREGTTEKIKRLKCNSMRDEVEQIAKIVKGRVIKGENRYCDFTVAFPDAEKYKYYVNEIFKGEYEIPYFLDERKSPKGHPLIRLILSYLDANIIKFEPSAFAEFYKNPIVNSDKNFTDKFENYLKKYNVCYNRLYEKLPEDGSDESYSEYEEFRQKLVGYLSISNVKKLLKILDIENKLKEIAKRTEDRVEAQIHGQIYEKVNNVLDNMEKMAGDSLTVKEFKAIFLSGIEGLELSVIPQCVDGVFMGSYREAALCKANTLFMIGLTSEVPIVQKDVALLSDGDIETSLQGLGPKIEVVNKRMAENVGVATISFDKELFLSCPASVGGKNTSVSQVITDIENLFDKGRMEFTVNDGIDFYTKKQGFNEFAKRCFEITDNQNKLDVNKVFEDKGCHKEDKQTEDFYFFLNSGSEEDKEKVEKFIAKINNNEYRPLGVNICDDVLYPTAIENFYSCPYKWFVSHVLRLSESETADIDGKLFGTIMHDIIRDFEKDIKSIKCKEQTDEKVQEIADVLAGREKYKRFCADKTGKANFNRITQIAKEICEKIRTQNENSDLTIASFEKETTLTEIDGKKVCGKPDRIDCDGKGNFIVVDYKTGDFAEEGKAKHLYDGTQLQLFLYALSQIKEGKTPIGLYYCNLQKEYKDKQNEFMKGVTLKSEDAKKILVKDEIVNEENKHFNFNGQTKRMVSEEAMDGCINYAEKMVRSAINAMQGGLIVPSPLEGACKYCEFNGMCGKDKKEHREINDVVYEDFNDSQSVGEKQSE